MTRIILRPIPVSILSASSGSEGEALTGLPLGLAPAGEADDLKETQGGTHATQVGPHQLPIMVCVDVSDTEEHERITRVVLGTDDEDRQPDRDPDGHVLVYDERMERISADEPYACQPLQAADPSQWPARRDWEEGLDALRDRWLYEDGDPEDDHDIGKVAVAVDPTWR